MFINITGKRLLFHLGTFTLLSFIISFGRSQKSLIFFFYFPNTFRSSGVPPHTSPEYGTHSPVLFLHEPETMCRPHLFSEWSYQFSIYSNIFSAHLAPDYMVVCVWLAFTIFHYLLPGFVMPRVCFYSPCILFLCLWVGPPKISVKVLQFFKRRARVE